MPNVIITSAEDTARELGLTLSEYMTIHKISANWEFKKSMAQLKKDDIVEFNLKLSQFKSQSTANIPKCPTCGSTNIKKISGTKRWLGTGLFGLASSDLGKTMQCNNCGAKW